MTLGEDLGVTPPMEDWDRPWLYPSLRVNAIPRLLEQLVTKGTHASFAALLFKSPRTPAGQDPVVNLQYSIECGAPGFDWVLLSARNIADHARVQEFMTGAGYIVKHRTMNGVRFLRVEQGDLAALGVRLCTETYGLAPDAELGLVVSGFEYQPDPASVAADASRLLRYFVVDQGSRLPARQADHYSAPEIWSDHGWQTYLGPDAWSAIATEITRGEFDALCRECENRRAQSPA